MSIQYHLYRNDGAGGPVDYSSIVATTASLSQALPALALGSDNLIAVRAYDTATGLEDKNVDAVVRIIVDATGADVTNRPPPPVFVVAKATSAGKATVTWGFNRLDFGGKPTGFKVWITAGTTVDYGASPALTMPYDSNPLMPYRATLTGLTDGTVYAIGVRAYNATGLSATAFEPSVTGRVSTAPDPAEDGSASVGFAP